MKNIYVVLGTIVVVVGVGLAAAHQAFFREFGEQNEALRKIVNQKHRQNVELSRLRQRLTDLEKSDQQAVQDLNAVKQRIPEQSNLLELFNDLQYQVLKSGMTLDRMTTPPPAPHEPGKLFRQPLTIEVSYRRSPGHDEAGKAQMMFLKTLSEYQRVLIFDDNVARNDLDQNAVSLTLNGFVPVMVVPSDVPPATTAKH